MIIKLLKTTDKDKTLKTRGGKIIYYILKNKDKDDSVFLRENNAT